MLKNKNYQINKNIKLIYTDETCASTFLPPFKKKQANILPQDYEPSERTPISQITNSYGIKSILLVRKCSRMQLAYIQGS